MITAIMIYLFIWVELQIISFFIVRRISEDLKKNEGKTFYAEFNAKDKKLLRVWSWILLLAPAWPVLVLVGLFAGIKWLVLNTEDTVKKAIKGVKQ